MLGLTGLGYGLHSQRAADQAAWTAARAQPGMRRSEAESPQKGAGPGLSGARRDGSAVLDIIYEEGANFASRSGFTRESLGIPRILLGSDYRILLGFQQETRDFPGPPGTS